MKTIVNHLYEVLCAFMICVGSVMATSCDKTLNTKGRDRVSDLSASASANCYIVSDTGLFKFKAVKGNSKTLIDAVSSVDVLWETFGTDVAPASGDLISAVSYNNGYVVFQIADPFKEGNALIAAKDTEGNVLWSWHIWLTDKPEGQVYYKNAGTMMDRNLGATSASPGDVCALGLIYQWGRKDPFLGSSSISEFVPSKSTSTWPAAVKSDVLTGTIEYATANPMVFITSMGEWYENITDPHLWTDSSAAKSIYDPCPVGWRVPDGGMTGVWSTPLALQSPAVSYRATYDNEHEGVNFSGHFGSDQFLWYPAAGYCLGGTGVSYDVGYGGYYWSASHFSGGRAYHMAFFGSGWLEPAKSYFGLAFGCSVRCCRE